MTNDFGMSPNRIYLRSKSTTLKQCLNLELKIEFVMKAKRDVSLVPLYATLLNAFKYHAHLVFFI